MDAIRKDLLIAAIADPVRGRRVSTPQDTVTGLVLAGVGQRDSHGANFLAVTAKTTKAEIEERFNSFITRPDVGVVILTQTVADELRFRIQHHTAALPIVLEIPSKEAPYDSSKDPIYRRVQQLVGE